MIFLKDRAFAWTRMAQETDFSAVLESYGDDKSKFVTPYGSAGQDDVGAWLIWDGRLFLISAVKPADDRSLTTITCREPMAVFDRDVYYTDAAYGSLNAGAFIVKVIEDEFIRQPDGFYALPQLVVRNWLDLPAIPPDDEPDGKAFNLYDYLTGLRDAFGVFVEMSLAGNAICADIRQRIPNRHNVVFGDGRATLTSREFGGANTVAKVTSIRNGTGTDWYLTRFGEIQTTPPTPRVEGRWAILPLSEDDDEGQKVREKFGRTSGAHKLAFRCGREFALGDEAVIRTDDELVTGRISSVTKTRGDPWYTYKTGDLAVTLTDKMQRSKT